MNNPSRLTVVVVLAVATLSGCGSSDTPASDSSAGSSSAAPTSAATSAAPTSTAPTSGTPATPSSPSSTSGAGGCTVSDLKVTLGPAQGAAGSTYFPLRLTNTSGHPCRTGGFGGVSLVGAHGRQLGAPADRVQKGKVTALTLPPQARAESTLRETNAENYSRGKCRPAPAKGFRVYPPNETRSAFVKHATTACASPGVHLLTLTPYHRIG